jgi:hypothetical protein
MTNRLTPPPEREFPAGRLQQRKEQLVSQIQADHPRRSWSMRRPSWPIALGAAAAVAAGVFVVTAVLPAGESGGPSPAAAAVLHRAARAAAKQPATAPPAPGQFVYTKSEGLNENTAVGDHKVINFFQTQTREIWIGPDGSGRLRESDGPPRFATSADRAAWVAAGKPDLTGDRTSDNTFGAGGLYYLDLSNVPTDPAQLKQLIDNRTIEGGPPGDAETFTIIGDLLRETYASPALRSALYTVAAELPGVQPLGTVHDQLGRSGTAVAYVSNGLSHELIFDPQTSALLAEQTTVVHPSQVKPSVPAGTVVDWTSYLSSGVVDSTTATP